MLYEVITHTAVRNKEKILIFGDFDADGVTATAMLYQFLSLVEADLSWYVPVITSYSIHYTKLYDKRPFFCCILKYKGCQSRRVADPNTAMTEISSGMGKKGFSVITSYSIHYTKLYEIQQKNGLLKKSTPSAKVESARSYASPRLCPSISHIKPHGLTKTA